MCRLYWCYNVTEGVTASAMHMGDKMRPNSLNGKQPNNRDIWPTPRLIRARRGLAGIDQATLADACKCKSARQLSPLRATRTKRWTTVASKSYESSSGCWRKILKLNFKNQRRKQVPACAFGIRRRRNGDGGWQMQSRRFQRFSRISRIAFVSFPSGQWKSGLGDRVQSVLPRLRTRHGSRQVSC